MPDGVDDEAVGYAKTFSLGPKALFAAESYVHGLFQLYPTVYFHKTTRGAEKLFTELLCRIITLARDGQQQKTGLGKKHPLVQFALNSDSLECAQNLDDEVVFGALSQTLQASDITVRAFSQRLRERQLYRCLDIRQLILTELFSGEVDKGETSKKIDAIFEELERKAKEWSCVNSKDVPRILFDKVVRKPYKKISESKGPVNQILIRTNDEWADIREKSDLVKSLEPFKISRAYFAKDDSGALDFLIKEVEALKRGSSNA